MNGQFRRWRAALLLSGAVVACCGGSQEQSLIDEFFAASRLRDKTALAKFSTVIFEPLQQGTVVDYEIAKVTRDGPTTRVSIQAKVKRPDGHVVPETILVLMQRSPDARLTITGLTEVP